MFVMNVKQFSGSPFSYKVGLNSGSLLPPQVLI